MSGRPGESEPGLARRQPRLAGWLPWPMLQSSRMTLAGEPTATTSAGRSSGHAGPCTDDRVGIDGHARINDDGAAEPDVVASHDGLCGLPLVSTGFGVKRMGSGQQLHIPADLHIVSDGHRGNIEEDRAPVDEGAGSDRRLVAAVAMERRSDLAASPHAPTPRAGLDDRERRSGPSS